MSEQTPGPWRVGDAGHTVFGPKTDNPSPQTVASNLSRANAALIVKAVNSHQELLDALLYLEEYLAALIVSGALNHGAIDIGEAQARTAKARAAIEKAEKGTNHE